MSSVQTLREFINERLTTAAGEIFIVFEQTIARYEEIVRQRKQQQITRKPQVKFHRAESPQKTSSSLELEEEHEAPHIKEEEEHEALHIKEEEDVDEKTVTDGESDDSLDSVRDLITQRLTAAAGEIFTVSEDTIAKYEEEIDRQRRLLEITWKPQIKLQRIELPQHLHCREEQLFKQETNYCLEQEELEPSQIKEEPEEPEEPGLLQIKEEPEEPGLPQFKEEPAEPGLPQFKEEPEEPQLPQIKEGQEDPGLLQKQAEGEKPRCEETRGDNVFKRKLCQTVGTVTKKKKVVCEICGKSYTIQQSLVIHMRTHTGEKPYSCETCGRSFNRRGTLWRHKKTHSGEKPFSCETCGKSYSRNSHLLRHNRTHKCEKRRSFSSDNAKDENSGFQHKQDVVFWIVKDTNTSQLTVSQPATTVRTATCLSIASVSPSLYRP